MNVLALAQRMAAALQGDTDLALLVDWLCRPEVETLIGDPAAPNVGRLIAHWQAGGSK